MIKNLNKLKELRARYNLKQSDMARILGINKTSYCKRENGKIPFTDNEITKMAEMFGVLAINEVFFNQNVALKSTDDEQAATTA